MKFFIVGRQPFVAPVPPFEIQQPGNLLFAEAIPDNARRHAADYRIRKRHEAVFDLSYNNEQTGSGVASDHHQDLVRQIRKAFPDLSTRIVEIGCGRGQLLKLLLEAGYFNVRGYDPAAPDSLGGIIRNTLWNGLDGDGAIDLLIFRHTLEELPDVDRFMQSITQTSVRHIYGEITNAEEIYRYQDAFSLYPEYVNIFSILSIAKLFARHEISITETRSYFDDSWLGIWGKINAPKSIDSDWNEILERCRSRIKSLSRPIVLWGGGGRGGNLLAFCAINDGIISNIVDQNPEKWNHHVPPHGQKVISPTELEALRPKHLIVVSKKYMDEILPHVPSGCRILTIDDLIN